MVQRSEKEQWRKTLEQALLLAMAMALKLLVVLWEQLQIRSHPRSKER